MTLKDSHMAVKVSSLLHPAGGFILPFVGASALCTPSQTIEMFILLCRSTCCRIIISGGQLGSHTVAIAFAKILTGYIVPNSHVYICRDQRVR